MKQDYLWDKTGSDPEIEGLENALAVFRCKETAPPAIQPAKVVPFKQKSPRRSFRVASAIAACTAFAMIGWGAWYQLSGYEIEFQENLVKTAQPPQIMEVQQEITLAKITDEIHGIKIETPKPTPARKFIRLSKTVSPEVPQKVQKIKNNVADNAEQRLTKEEKYAYDQLMLALSITSSKLKIVKDKVQSKEVETDVVEKGR